MKVSELFAKIAEIEQQKMEKRGFSTKNKDIISMYKTMLMQEYEINKIGRAHV